MDYELTADELVSLINRVFEPRQADKQLAILIDLPDRNVPDNDAWEKRRKTAALWRELLSDRIGECSLEAVNLILYRNVRSNNAELPIEGYYHMHGALPKSAEELKSGRALFEEIFKSHQLFVAPTEFSTTAPLKIAAKKYDFRAATMPGFNLTMVSALRLDYSIVEQRVNVLKAMLDNAESCHILFEALDCLYTLNLDLRYRLATSSSGTFKKPQEAGNLPSGESYIVPYEGEISGDPSRTSGKMPVQLGEDVVIYNIEENRARNVLTDNEASKEEAARLENEPAYGNIAELGLGVLGDLGLKPTGSILLDEKLGLHIAFGRSDHFGGQVGLKDFRSLENVVHIDRVYIPELQPKVKIVEASLEYKDGSKTLLIKDGKYQIEM